MEIEDKRVAALQMYLDSNGEATNVDIAITLDVPDSTIRTWKSRDKWKEKLKQVETSQKKEPKNVALQVKEYSCKTSKTLAVKKLAKSGLTNEQQLFCIYYTKYFNAAKAYQKAYGCSYSTANAHGYKLLMNVGIRQEIEKLKLNKLNRAMLGPEDIVQRYIDIAFSDITDFAIFGTEEVPAVGPGGVIYIDDEETGERKILMKKVNTVEFVDSSKVDGFLISEVKVGRDGASVKLQDKMKALEWLADHCNLMSDMQQHRVEQERARLEIERERLAIDAARAGAGSDDDDDTGVIVLAEIIEDADDEGGEIDE